MFRRAIAYLIDYLTVSLILLIVCMNIGTLPFLNTNADFPFLIIGFIYVPHVFWYNAYKCPNYYFSSWLLLIILCSIIIESLVYTFEEFYFGKTLGKKFMCLKIEKNVCIEYPFITLFCRNMLKIVSKFLLGIPFILMFFSKKQQTIYDKITNINIINDN